MAKVQKNPQGTDKMFDSRTCAAFPNDEGDKAGMTFESGKADIDRNVNPSNEGGFRAQASGKRGM